jgi:hypothetical protein
MNDGSLAGLNLISYHSKVIDFSYKYSGQRTFVCIGRRKALIMGFNQNHSF